MRDGLRSVDSPSLPTAYCLLPTRRAFTLTELLVVIAIIAVLSSLIGAAALNAWRNAQRNRIKLEIQNISGALENFKIDLGAYPPNGMNPAPDPTSPTAGSEAALVQSDFQRMFKQAFPSHQEPPGLILALCGQSTATGNYNVEKGLTAAEALPFWLGGFSDDPKYPITGPGGPSYSDATGNNDGSLDPSDEVMENRKWRYEFDVTRLGPRTEDGLFDVDRGRWVQYEIDLNGDGDVNDPGEERGVNLWRYTPKGSEQPLVYFDVSRHKPYQYDAWAADTSGANAAPYIFALKELRSGTTGVPATAAEYASNVVFVDQGKYQILHTGLDDAWGDHFQRMSFTDPNGWGYAEFGGSGETELLLYPEGPFLDEMGDTLTSFTEGTLADETEE